MVNRFRPIIVYFFGEGSYFETKIASSIVGYGNPKDSERELISIRCEAAFLCIHKPLNFRIENSRVVSEWHESLKESLETLGIHTNLDSSLYKDKVLNSTCINYNSRYRGDLDRSSIRLVIKFG